MKRVTPEGQKLAGIDLRGKNAVRSGFREFAGFPESLRNNFIVALMFSSDSESQIRERLIKPIERIGSQGSVGFILGGRDFPIHSTILEATSDLLAPEVVAQLASGEVMSQISADLVGKTFEYKYALVDSGNIVLGSIQVPESVKKARRELADLYTQNGLKPKPIDNLLHITLSRIVSIPGGVDWPTEVMRHYKNEMIKLRHQISTDPLKLTVASVSAATSYDFLHER